MSGKDPGDKAHRDRLLNELDQSFIVEAAAGTGKTTVLIRRIVAVIETGRARLGQLIAVTFTEKAAGEMKLRLREELEDAHRRTEGEPHARLARALEELELARVGTIHGLCAELLREHPVEAGVDPRFEVLSDEAMLPMRNAAFDRWFEQTLREPPEGVRRVLRRPGFGDTVPRDELFRAFTRLIEHRDFEQAWERPVFDQHLEAERALGPVWALASVTQGMRNVGDSWTGELLEDVARFIGDLEHRETIAPRDYDHVEAQLRMLSTRSGWDSPKFHTLSFRPGLKPADVEKLLSAAQDALKRFVRQADADIAGRLHAELKPAIAEYEREKDALGSLDYVDLLLHTRDMLRRSPEVRASLQRAFTRLFVDEFQDTDPVQAEILLLLASDDPKVAAPLEAMPTPGKLFIVADPKQAIYRFRRADVQFFLQVKAHLLTRGVALEHLSTSFRSTPGIQAAVNGAFALAMTGEHQAQYVALDQHRPATPDQPSVIALSVARPYSSRGTVTKGAVEESVPQTVAAFIQFLVRDSGWRVCEREQLVPVEPKHVCILFRRFVRFNDDVARPYAKALEDRGIPHVLVGGRSFHSREEVSALRTALKAIERPDDELSVYATLRGPFLGATDGELLAHRAEHHRLWPGKLPQAKPGLVTEGLRLIHRLHFRRNRRPVAETVHDFLESVRAHAGIAFWHGGDQALANVLQLADLCARYERAAGSFRGVVQRLEHEASSGDAPEAPIVEEGSDGVRMMTVHNAKGLEFPVVILAEPTYNAARRDMSHWVSGNLWAETIAHSAPLELLEHENEVRQRDAEESVRLTYVAATRASDVLVVPAVADRQFADTWTEVLYPSLYPDAARAKAPNAAPGTPIKRGDTVLDPTEAKQRPDEAPRAGLHLATTGKNRVVWWDPSTLDFDAGTVKGLDRDELLRPDDGSATAAEGKAAWSTWAGQRTQRQQTASTPQVTVVTIKELTAPMVAGAIAVEQTQAVQPGRPGGRRFGVLVHAALARVELSARPEAVRRVVELEAALTASTPEEIEAAVVAVNAALAHPLLKRAAALPQAEVRREAPVVHQRPDGTVFEGACDLAYPDEGGWRVVEFKTDEELESHRAQYEAQTEAYASAIEAATGLPARGVILRV